MATFNSDAEEGDESAEGHAQAVPQPQPRPPIPTELTAMPIDHRMGAHKQHVHAHARIYIPRRIRAWWAATTARTAYMTAMSLAAMIRACLRMRRRRRRRITRRAGCAERSLVVNSANSFHVLHPGAPLPHNFNSNSTSGSSNNGESAQERYIYTALHGGRPRVIHSYTLVG